MPNRKSAAKSLLTSEKGRGRNRTRKSQVKTAERKFLDLVTAGSAEEARGALDACFSVLDKAAKKGVITKNKANRKKSRLSIRLAKTTTA